MSVKFIFTDLMMVTGDSDGSSRCNTSIASVGNSRGSNTSNTSIASVGNSRGSSVADSVGDSRNDSSSMFNVGRFNSNGAVDGGVDGGGVLGDYSLGRVGVDSGVVDMGLLNNLLDRVDLVGGRNRDSSGYGNLIGGGHVLVNNNSALNGDRDMDGDINVVVLYIELRDDVGLLGSDPGVGPHGSKDPLLGDGVSRGRTSRDRGRGDGSGIGGSVRDCWGGKRTGFNMVLGSSSHIRSGRLRDGFNSSNNMLVSSNNGGSSSLHHLMSNNSIFNLFVHHWGSSSIGLVSLASHCGSRGHSGTSGNGGSSSVGRAMGYSRSSCVGSVADCGDTSMSDRSHSIGGSTMNTGHEGESNQKSVHV